MKDDNPEIEICPGITRRTVAHGKNDVSNGCDTCGGEQDAGAFAPAGAARAHSRGQDATDCRRRAA